MPSLGHCPNDHDAIVRNNSIKKPDLIEVIVDFIDCNLWAQISQNCPTQKPKINFVVSIFPRLSVKKMMIVNPYFG